MRLINNFHYSLETLVLIFLIPFFDFSVRCVILWMQDRDMDQHEDECRNGGESNSKQDDEVVIIQLFYFAFVVFSFDSYDYLTSLITSRCEKCNLSK